MQTKIDANAIQWTDPTSDVPLYLCGPSHNALIQAGDSNCAQLFHVGMGSALSFGGAGKIGFALKVGTSAQYQDSTFYPQTHIDRQSRITFAGAGSVNGNPLSWSHFLAGKPDGQTAYLVVDITNTGAGAVAVSPTVILATWNLQNFRWENVGNADTDVLAWDSTNAYLAWTTPAISNIYAGLKACTTTQHHYAQAAYLDIISTYLSAGDLPDTIGTLGTQNYVYSQYGATASELSIAAGATQRFVWCLAYRTTLTSLQTFMAGLTATPTADLSAEDGYHTPANALSIVCPQNRSLSFLFDETLARLNVQAHSQTINGHQGNAAGSYTFTYPFGRDGYYGATALIQAGGAAIVADEYQLFKSYQQASGQQMHEVAQYTNATGLYITASNNGTPGDQDAWQLLKAYAYYCATQDNTFLTTELPTLNQIATYLYTSYTAGPKYGNLYPGAGAATYPDGEGNITGSSPVHDLVLHGLYTYALQRLAELNTVAGNTSQAATWTAFAATLSAALPTFWNPSANWPYFNITPAGTFYPNKHLCMVDAPLWGIFPAAYSQAMATDLLTSAWWDSTNTTFNMMPTTDPLYSSTDYWYGLGWNMTFFKAIECLLRYGTPDQAQTGWDYLQRFVLARMNNLKGNMAEKCANSGLFCFSAGGMVELVVRGLFGIDAHATSFTIAPTTNKLTVGGTWTAENVLLGNQRYTLSVSGAGPIQTTSVNGVAQPTNTIAYGGGTTVAVVFSGRHAA